MEHNKLENLPPSVKISAVQVKK